MILKGSQRGGATQLAAHLLRVDENDHVELHEITGFIAGDVRGALREAYAVSKGTKCQQFLFSLSLSPPASENVPVAVFGKALAQIEAKLGLTGQPRIVVFHEKQGRRHAHCVWSRIDVEAMKAINLPHFKLKLRDVARELFFEHQWLMPAGLTNSAERDPRNFIREEWQQAKRAEKDAGELKETFQDCWVISDSGKAFAQALEARGLYLARGDRRGFVAIDVKGEVYSIPKWTGLKTKQVEARLGDPGLLRSVDGTKAYIADLLAGMLGHHLAETEEAFEAQRSPLIAVKQTMRAMQRERRTTLLVEHRRRAETEALQRVQRFRTGLRGLWDRLTGRQASLQRENAFDADAARRRDEAERQEMVRSQLAERRRLQLLFAELTVRYRADVTEIHHERTACNLVAQPVPHAAVNGLLSRSGRRRHLVPAP